MKIATVLNIHANEELVIDTIDSINKYVSTDTLAIIDGAAAKWGNSISIPAYKAVGFYHNYYKSPYRNMAFGLRFLAESFDADWYCYTEPDVLFCSEDFKEDLEEKAALGYWCVGNDHRIENYKMPAVEKHFKIKFNHSEYLLGCCVFFHKTFIKKLLEIDFFTQFIKLTNCFNRNFPQFTGYDISEHVYPTLARYLGGKVGGLAHWTGTHWLGKYERYPMRFRPDITEQEFFTKASIFHPIKDFMHPIRIYHREKRSKIV